MFGREIGLAFQLLDDVLDVAGPPERTGKARGTDLLDGTVTLPLIVARERDAGAAPGSTSVALDAAAAESGVRPDRRHGRARGGARRRPRAAWRRQSASSRARRLDDGQRDLLAMVADGVVERYA